MWLCVDWAEGTGLHELTTRLHLAPEVVVTRESPQVVCLLSGGQALRLQSLSAAEIAIEEGWYCPEFGVRQRTSVLNLTARSPLPGFVGWMVQDIAYSERAALQAGPDGVCLVHMDAGESETIWNVSAGSAEQMVRTSDTSRRTLTR